MRKKIKLEETPEGQIMDEINKKMPPEEVRAKVDKMTKKFMTSVKKFLTTKGGGEIPEEWGASMMILEAYYRQFCELNIEISQLDTLLIQGRYGVSPSPLLACRDKASVRLEAMLKEMGLTMAKAMKMNVVDVKKAKSSLEVFLDNQNEKIERR